MSRVRAALAGAVVGAVLLAGCTAQPGTAAVIDGRTITEAELDRTIEEVGPLLSGADTRGILVLLMIGPYFIEAAEENGVEVSETETRALLDAAATEAGLEVHDWSESSVDLIRFTLATNNLAGTPEGQEVLEAAEAEAFGADVTVNPRYGELDAEARAILPTDLPWIVDTAVEQPAEEPAQP